jgi:hypothetical protein
MRQRFSVMAGKIQSPEKELRFTRAGQSIAFWLVAAVLIGAGIILAVTALCRDLNPRLPHPAWAILPILLAAAPVKLAIHLTRHAYLILTPLGIEIFPFFRASQGMQLIMWQEIATAEVNAAATQLTLHRNFEKSSGIHLSLWPISKHRRSLLAKAVIGRLAAASDSR